MIRAIHRFLEKNILFFGLGVLIVSIVGGLAQIVPVVFDDHFRTPAPNLKPYSALELAGRDLYIREGCGLCHTQQVRPLLGETVRYGIPNTIGDTVYDYPFLWGSKRTGPDLSNLYGKYSDNWQRQHLLEPTRFVPASIMPSYPWLESAMVVDAIPDIDSRMKALAILGVPYTEDQIANAQAMLEQKTELDAMVAYLQTLGRHRAESLAQERVTLEATP